MTEPPDLRFRVLNWIAIVNQLAVTRANRLLEDSGLPFPQFTLLLHFEARQDRKHTVTAVANAFQQPQPGVTKTLQKLEDKGFLYAEAHPSDRRAQHLSITPAGLAAVASARALLAPMLNDIFDGWTGRSLAEAFDALDRLKTALDPARPESMEKP